MSERIRPGYDWPAGKTRKHARELPAEAERELLERYGVIPQDPVSVEWPDLDSIFRSRDRNLERFADTITVALPVRAERAIEALERAARAGRALTEHLQFRTGAFRMTEPAPYSHHLYPYNRPLVAYRIQWRRPPIALKKTSGRLRPGQRPRGRRCRR